MIKVLLLALIVGTWNGKWFPSGRADHRAHPDVEAATIKASGRMIARGLHQVDTNETEDVVLVFNEIRNREAAEALVSAIGRTNLVLASISGYRRRNRLDYQQDFIATTLPVAEANWANWEYRKEANPPRGYAFAAVVVEPAVTAKVYAVHLKSNYGAKDPDTARYNRLARANAIEQVIAKEKDSKYVILAGDFNADKWKNEFAEEAVFPMLEKAGYSNPLELLSKRARWTYPNKRYGNSALDYIMLKGFVSPEKPIKVPNTELSDHYFLLTQVEKL